jgi:hypothetical protein
MSREGTIARAADKEIVRVRVVVERDPLLLLSGSQGNAEFRK